MCFPTRDNLLVGGRAPGLWSKIAWLVVEIRLFKIPIDFLAKHPVIASGFSRLAKTKFQEVLTSLDIIANRKSLISACGTFC